jgi:hypothetical protein
MAMSIWRTRVIREGSIKAFGKYWIIDNDRFPYDGRLEGMKYHIGFYGAKGYYTDRKILPFAHLWGTGSETYDDPGPHCINGVYYWESVWEEGWDRDNWFEHQRAYMMKNGRKYGVNTTRYRPYP